VAKFRVHRGRDAAEDARKLLCTHKTQQFLYLRLHYENITKSKTINYCIIV